MFASHLKRGRLAIAFSATTAGCLQSRCRNAVGDSTYGQVALFMRNDIPKRIFIRDGSVWKLPDYFAVDAIDIGYALAPVLLLRKMHRRVPDARQPFD